MPKTTYFIYLISVKKKHLYVGMTNDPRRREREHLNSLIKGNHSSIELQQAYNQCHRFKFKVLKSFKNRDSAVDFELDMISKYGVESGRGGFYH